MKVKILLLLFLATIVFSATKTVTSFTPEKDINGDEYGNKRFNREVQIDTQNFKVDNFFSKFSDEDGGSSNYSSISRKGLFEVTVEANSICANDKELQEEGCSGQKPFLMKKSFVDTMSDGQVYEVPFAKASQFNTENESFFALDIDRTPENFQTSEEPASGKKSFFQKIKDMFKNYYSADVNFFGTNLTADEKASRDRYIANIVAGIEKDKRLTKKIDAKTHNTPIQSTINTPVSLLEYEAMMSSQKTACKGIFITRDPDSLFCRMLTGFDMAAWMPFFSTTNEINTETSSVMVDTETALLTAVGKLNNTNVFNDMKTKTESTSFFSEIFKPVINMFDKMMSFFFGSRDDAKAVVYSNHYDFTTYENQLTMTVPTTTDGTEVDGFSNFTLTGLDSVYGTEVTVCKIVQKEWFFMFPTYKHYTVTSSDSSYKEYRIDHGMGISEAIYESTYDELDFNDNGFNDINLETTRDDMLSWCARRQAHNSKGIIGRIKDFFGISDILMWKRTKEEQMDALLDDKDFEVEEYTEKTHRGLILHLKKEELTTNNPANKINIKLIKSIK